MIGKFCEHEEFYKTLVRKSRSIVKQKKMDVDGNEYTVQWTVTVRWQIIWTGAQATTEE